MSRFQKLQMSQELSKAFDKSSRKVVQQQELMFRQNQLVTANTTKTERMLYSVVSAVMKVSLGIQDFVLDAIRQIRRQPAPMSVDSSQYTLRGAAKDEKGRMKPEHVYYDARFYYNNARKSLDAMPGRQLVQKFNMLQMTALGECHDYAVFKTQGKIYRI